MRDLIERVAEKAGWRKTAPPLAYYFIEEWWPLATFDGKLSAEGLVFLLRELLDAYMYPRRHRVTGDFQVFSDIDVCRVSASNTLEEAVMLAFLHKGER